MDRWFMVFDKELDNNMEVPLYFLWKVWEEVMLGLHVNYFDINEFHGVSLGYSQDWESDRNNLVLGPHPPWWIFAPPIQHPPIGGNIAQT